MKTPGANYIFRKRSLTLLSSAAGIFVITALSIVIDGGTERIRSSDVAVIFGTTVNSDGVLSPRLAARLDTVVTLYIPRLSRTRLLDRLKKQPAALQILAMPLGMPAVFALHYTFQLNP